MHHIALHVVMTGRLLTAAVVALFLFAMINIPLAYGSVSNGCNNSSIVPTEPVLMRIHSNTLTEISEGQHLVISTTVSDRCGVDHPVITIIEVRDSNDVTIFLGLQNFTIKANSQTEVGRSWVPTQAGEFQLRAFTLVSFDSLGAPSVTTSKIDVAESDDAFIVISYNQNPALQKSNFEPNFITVVLGINNTVRWTNGDAVAHRLAGQGIFDKPIFIYPGFSFSHTFTESGLFEYRDPDRFWMRGLVQVFPLEAIDAHLELAISGLKDAYRLGETAEFAMNINGYETGCGTFEAQVEKVDASGDPFGHSLMASFDCIANPSFKEIDRFPSGQTMPFSIPINQTGTYRVTASFEGTVASTSLTEEFTVS